MYCNTAKPNLRQEMHFSDTPRAESQSHSNCIVPVKMYRSIEIIVVIIRIISYYITLYNLPLEVKLISVMSIKLLIDWTSWFKSFIIITNLSLRV